MSIIKSKNNMYPMDENFVSIVNLEKDECFDYFMVDKRTKVLILGNGVDSFDNMQGVLCNTEIESIILEGNHNSLVLIDGILYEKIEEEYTIYDEDFLEEHSHLDNDPQYYFSKLSLVFIPPKMNIKKYIVPIDCIDFSPFFICNNTLEEIIFHDNFLLMQNMCFNDCSKLKSISLPKSLVGIGEYPLNISGLEKITIDSENKYFTVKDNTLLNFSGTKLIAIPPGLRVEEYVIPDSVINAEEYLSGNNYIKKYICLIQYHLLLTMRFVKETQC